MIRFSDPAAIVERLSFIDRIVVFAWITLTVLMVLSYRTIGPDDAWASRAVLVFIAITWAQPIYSTIVGPITSSVFALTVLIAVLLVVFTSSPKAGLLLLPTLPWLVAATIYTMARGQLGLLNQ